MVFSHKEAFKMIQQLVFQNRNVSIKGRKKNCNAKIYCKGKSCLDNPASRLSISQKFSRGEKSGDAQNSWKRVRDLTKPSPVNKPIGGENATSPSSFVGRGRF